MTKIRSNAILFCMICSAIALSQELKVRKNYGGVLSLGGRSTMSTFNDGKWSDIGIGSGGQFMLQASNRVNTAWFFDYITSGIGGFANRTDYHIGWSVMYYLVPSSPERLSMLQPYVLAGHCFDYSNLKENADHKHFAERWSSAVQAGLGTSVNLSRRLDAMIQAQYMIHLGNDVEAEKENNIVVFEKKVGMNLEGHILITLSLNYKIADIW
jgi:hypothetical protein